MPSTGTPSSSSRRRNFGAPCAYTDAGPPDSTSPRGRRRSSSSTGMSCGSSSEKTPHSLIRRAISCEYCPPKSSTKTSSTVAGRSVECAGAGVEAVLVIQFVDSREYLCASVGAHADVLLALKLLALRLQRGRD